MVNLNEFSKGIQHVGIPSSDVDRTIEFYESLGFEVVLMTSNKPNDDKVAFLKMGNLVIESYGNHDTVKRVGAIDHIAIDVKNIEKLYEEIKAAGYRFAEPGLQSLPFWDNGIKYFIILGPDDEKLEFCEIL